MVWGVPEFYWEQIKTRKPLVDYKTRSQDIDAQKPGLRSDQWTQRAFDWTFPSLPSFSFWTTVPSKRQIGGFAVANKEGGAHRFFSITQK